MSKSKNDLLLEVDALDISYEIDGKWIQAISDFCMDLRPGQIYGLVGESGSGKSTIAQGLMRYLSANGRIGKNSKIAFMGNNIAKASPQKMRTLWTQQIKFVPQNAGAALNPSIKIGKQMTEVVEHALGIKGRQAVDMVIDMFTKVQLVDPQKVFDRYAHEISGGMQQRVVIAMALITNPDLLIMDEPTTGLDVTTEAIILDLVRNLIAERDTGVVYITHNLGVVAQLCERVIVLYAGEIMADASVDQLFAMPLHPYTMGLLNSIPRPGMTKRDSLLQSIHGSPPSLRSDRSGCVFAGRCPFVIDKCRIEKPPLERFDDGRGVKCHRWQEVQSGDLVFATEEALSIDHDLDEATDIIMEIASITKHFPVQRTIQNFLDGEQPAPIRAVDGVNLNIREGHTLGLVGESGSGKTTLSRVIIGLQERTAGSIELLGMDIRDAVRDRSPDVLAKIQMVFQNPQNSLNPYMSVQQCIRRPLMKLRGLSRDEADKEVLELLKAVNLREEYAERFPGELSGGEKQRVVIARAFASNPDLIICDEPVSALDVSVQSAVLNLLARLQDENGTSYLFISHDLAVVGYLADYIAVMYLGQLFEVGTVNDLFNAPYHPYTEALVSAIPVASPEIKENRVLLNNSVPSAQNVPSGCRFHTRCPRKIGAICEEEVPPWLEDSEGHHIRCHISPQELRALQTTQEQEMDGA